MNIHDLILELQMIQFEHGDIPIVIEGELGYFEAESANVVEIDPQWFVQSPRGVVIS